MNVIDLGKIMEQEIKGDILFYENSYYENDKEYTIKCIKRNFESSEINNKVILDYGCGDGSASLYFAKHLPKSIYGIDAGKKGIAYARELSKDMPIITFIAADLNNYEIAKDTYDIIWSDTVIEFLRKPLYSIILDFKNALRKDGILYISFTNDVLYNRIVHMGLRILKAIVPDKMRFIFSYLILLRYYIYKIFNKDFIINHESIKNRGRYIFMPYMRLISEREISKILIDKGFKILYIRERLNSDNVTTFSMPHSEIKAVKVTD